MPRNKTTFLAAFGMALLVTASPLFASAEIAYDSGKRRDPFVPLTGEDVSMAASASGVKLEGIIYDPGNQSVAILNGKPYQAGDPVGDATVVSIHKDHVVVSVSGEEKTLRLREAETL